MFVFSGFTLVVILVAGLLLMLPAEEAPDHPSTRDSATRADRR